jgi:hypothetical protein
MISELMFDLFLILLFPGVIGMGVVLAYRAFTASDKRANLRNAQLLDNERANIENRNLELQIQKSALELKAMERQRLGSGK